MTTLQLHITAGPQAGARFQLNQPQVTFGRSPENTIVLDVDVVSRQHGELVLDEGEWLLINHSQNGTRVGRKKVTKKPYVLRNGSSVSIADTEVFRVYLVEEGEDPSAVVAAIDEAEAEQPDRAPGTGIKGRSKLWVGLAIWIAVCLGAIIFVATSGGGDQEQNNGPGFWNPGQSLSDMDPGPDADRAHVRRILNRKPPGNDPNESRYAAHLDSARSNADQGTTGLYQAYRHYRQAMSYAADRDQPLQATDQIIYDNIIDRLAEIIAVEYRQAYRLYHQGRYTQTRDILDDLRTTYYSAADAEDELANHIRRLRNAAHKKAG